MYNYVRLFKENNMEENGDFYSRCIFGTAGLKVLSSSDAKKFYTNCTAAILRGKDCLMKVASSVQENAEDIYADAKIINEEREAAAEFEDAYDEENEEVTEEETTETEEA